MTAHTPPAWVAALREGLLPALARADLRINVRVRLNLEAWIEAAQQRGQLPATPEGMRNVLRAIVCKSPREQASFDEAFTRWLDSGDAGQTAPVTGAPAGAAAAGRGTSLDTVRPWWSRLAGLLLVALALASAWGLYRWFAPTPPPGPVVAPLPQQRAETPSAATPVVPERVRTPIEIGLPVTPVVVPPPWLFGIHPLWYTALVLLLGGIGYTVRTTQRRQIARLSVGARENLRELEVFARQLLPASGARRQALRDAARALRRPMPAEGYVLDLPASVQASTRAAGRLAPVFRPREVTPEYLVLIDRSRPGEPFGQLAHEMVRGLAVEGVSLQAYEFDRDPRWVAPFGADHGATGGARRRYQPLASLGARQGGQGLLVFTDGQGLVDPAAGALHDWVAPSFAAWPRRALLTPVPVASWGALEDLIAGDDGPDGAAAASFLLLPAQTYALPALADSFRGKEPEIALLPGAPGRLPPLLQGGTARWLSWHRPDAATAAQLLQQLQAYLGPTAFVWLAASAAYPHVSADLTRCLARELGADDAAPALATDEPPRTAPPDPRLLEARLLALAHLPWFRHGLIPDWLRAMLLRSMPPGVLARIREIMRGLFDTAGGSAGAGALSLGKIATDAEVGAGPRWRVRLRDWQRRIGLGGLAEDEPDDSPLRDVIYLGVLRGNIDAALALDATDTRLGALGSEVLPPLTRNPLRWMVALWVSLAFPVELVLWLAESALRRVAALPLRPQREEPAAPEASPVAAAAQEVAAVPRPPRILISCRDDDIPTAAALARALLVRYGIEGAFSGAEIAAEIAAGSNWQQEVEEQVNPRTAALLVVISAGWIEAAVKRSDSPLARELQVAVRQGKLVVPVIVGADVLRSEALPPWAATLSQMQAVTLSDLAPQRVDAAADEIGRMVFRAMPAETGVVSSA